MRIVLSRDSPDDPCQSPTTVAQWTSGCESGPALVREAVTANSVKIERMGKRNVYAVEIIADKDAAEWDVFVDIETGEVVGTDR